MVEVLLSSDKIDSEAQRQAHSRGRRCERRVAVQEVVAVHHGDDLVEIKCVERLATRAAA